MLQVDEVLQEQQEVVLQAQEVVLQQLARSSESSFRSMTSKVIVSSYLRLPVLVGIFMRPTPCVGRFSLSFERNHSTCPLNLSGSLSKASSPL